MEEILHHLIGSLSNYVQGFIHPRWLFGISAINSIFWRSDLAMEDAHPTSSRWICFSIRLRKASHDYIQMQLQAEDWGSKPDFACCVQHRYLWGCAPPKSSIESENGPLEEDIPFGKHHFFRFHSLNFGGLSQVLICFQALIILIVSFNG